MIRPQASRASERRRVAMAVGAGTLAQAVRANDPGTLRAAQGRIGREHFTASRAEVVAMHLRDCPAHQTARWIEQVEKPGGQPTQDHAVSPCRSFYSEEPVADNHCVEVVLK